MWIILGITLTLILLYALLLLWLFTGLGKGSPTLIPALDFSGESLQECFPEGPPMVSLIVPFRDEMQHLPSLMRDLEVQEWPEEKAEFIFVNDHSLDGSGEWVRDRVRDRPGFRYLELKEGEHGKKKALETGIRAATGEWIIQTDADCRVGPHFLASHLMARELTGADLIAGLVTTREGNRGIPELLERLDLLGLAGVAAGSFARGRPFLCSGANLSYSSRLYRQTRPFDPVDQTASGDDMFLMIGARKLDSRLAYMTAPDAVVRTGPSVGMRKLVRQRIRWGGKAGLYRMPDIQAFALLTLLTHLFLLAMPWLILLQPEVWAWMLTGYIGKSLADFLLICRTARFTGQQRDLRWYLPVSMLYYPFMGLVMTGALFGKGKWKS